MIQADAATAPFLIATATPAQTYLVWFSSTGGFERQPICFFGVGPAGNSRALGDTAVLWRGEGTSMPPPPNDVMVLAPGSDPAALAEPVDFTWILDDAGSGNPQSISYFWPVAPEGYTALGVCWSGDGKPSPSSYWCVANRYCQPCGTTPFWSDEGQGWKHHSGNLLQPTLTNPAAGLIVPTTFLSAEFNGNSGSTNAFALQTGGVGAQLQDKAGDAAGHSACE